jgi:hypothetical protein
LNRLVGRRHGFVFAGRDHLRQVCKVIGVDYEHERTKKAIRGSKDSGEIDVLGENVVDGRGHRQKRATNRLALATYRCPSTEPPAGLFNTVIFCPSVFSASAPMIRMLLSTAPRAKGTTVSINGWEIVFLQPRPRRLKSR